MFLTEQKNVVNVAEPREKVDVEDSYDSEELDYLDSAVHSSQLNREESSSHTSTFGSTFDWSDMFQDVHPNVVIGAGVASLIVAIVLLFALVMKKKAPRNRFLKWLREYLNFRSILIAGIIKFVYMFLAVFLTIMSVVVMCSGKDDMTLPMILIGLLILIVGNILLRVLLELTMAVIVIWENTSDMRSVVVKDEEKPEEKKPKEPKEPKEEKVEEKPVVEEVVVEQPITEEVAVEQQQVEVQQPVEQPPAAQPPEVQQSGA